MLVDETTNISAITPATPPRSQVEELQSKEDEIIIEQILNLRCHNARRVERRARARRTRVASRTEEEAAAATAAAHFIKSRTARRRAATEEKEEQKKEPSRPTS